MQSNTSVQNLISTKKLYSNGTDDEVDFKCYGSEDVAKCVSKLVNCYAMMISIPCLIITFVVYVILPDKNVHKRALLNYVFSLLCAYVCQVTLQLVEKQQGIVLPTPCQIFGYFLVFFFIVAFFWMNVMSIDMWLAFSGFRGISSRKDNETKMFVLFCIYAWGIPALLVLLIYLTNTFADKTAIYYPQLGESKCFLGDGYPKVFYFYLPMSILIIINVVLCILTAMKIKKFKKETSMLYRLGSKRHYENDKQKFQVYVKLIFAMGINWSLEVISFITIWQWEEVPYYVWYLTDCANAGHGVIIFFIFVFKRNVWNQLKKRYNDWKGQSQLHRKSNSQTTRSSNFSLTDAVTTNSDISLTEYKNGRIDSGQA